MKKTTTATLLAAAASTLSHAEDKVSVQHLNYQENQQRMSVSDWVISTEQNPNVDHQIKVNIGLDSLSGASPAWQPKVFTESAPDNVQQAASSNIYGIDTAGYEVKKVTIPDEDRKSVGLSWLSRNKKRHELSLGADYSEEPDYKSRSASANYMWFADRYKNRSYSVGASVQSNNSKAFDPNYQPYWEDLIATNIQVGLTQVMSQRSLIDANVFTIYDSGYLTNHYQTILRQFDGDGDGVVETYLSAEHRPDVKMGFGVASKWLMQWNPKISTHLGLRLYSDDWGIQSQTLNAKSYLNVIKNWTFHALFRFYNQTAANFYKDPDGKNPEFAITGYGSSDHRLGAFTANTYELGAAYEWNNTFIVNLQAGNYEQSEGFAASWISSGFTIKY